MLDEKDLLAISKMLEQQEQRILSQSAHNTRLILENVVDPKFNLLAEGQKDLLEAITPRSEIEQLHAEMDVLRAAFRAMSRDVEELKKAQ